MNLTMSTTAQVVETLVIVSNGTTITRAIMLNLLLRLDFEMTPAFKPRLDCQSLLGKQAKAPPPET